MRIHRFLALGAIAMILALLAACGGDEDPTPTSPPAAQPTPTPSEQMMEATPTAEAMMEKPTPTAEAMAEEPTPTPQALRVGPTATPVPPPAGFDAEEYFGGKTIRIIVGASPGGGYDTFSRLVAQAAERYFPESTRFIVQNLPGAGQLRGLRAVVDSDPDGYTIGPTHSRWFQRQLYVGDVTGFDIDTIHILGSPTFSINEDGFCLDRNFASSWQEVLDKGLTIKVGSAGPGNEPAIEFMIANGGPFKMVYGYGGTSEIMAAFDRGEVDGTNRCSPGTAGRLYPEWIEDERLIPIFYEVKPYNDEWLAELGHTGPLPSYLDLPGITYDDPIEAKANELNQLVAEISRVFFLPPGVPDDVKQYWQSAFDQMMDDAQFKEQVAIAGYADSLGYGRAEDILGIVEQVRNTTDEIRDAALRLSGVDELIVN
jgi:tripartite-type tricarboxylate transporter receptor subunit TctC